MIKKSLRRGFTLIELLVVVAIIAVLIALLMPALSEAKMVSNRSLCLSNLRATGVGFKMYASEWQDSILATMIVPDGHYRTWVDLLGYGYDIGMNGTGSGSSYTIGAALDSQTWPSYVAPKATRCPISPTLAQEAAVKIYNPRQNGEDTVSFETYAIYDFNGYYDNPNWNFVQILKPNPTANAFNWSYTCHKLNLVPNAQTFVLLADSNGTYQTLPNTQGYNWSVWQGDAYFGTCGIWCGHGKGGKLPLNGGTGGPGPSGSTYPTIGPGYSGGTANAEYYDGHAEVNTPYDLRHTQQGCHYFWDQSGTIPFWVK
jgi:prepilin-type N-terminal cleavage/methylation domain-containing protein